MFHLVNTCPLMRCFCVEVKDLQRHEELRGPEKTISSTCHFHWLGSGPITGTVRGKAHTIIQRGRQGGREKDDRMKVIFIGLAHIHHRQSQCADTCTQTQLSLYLSWFSLLQSDIKVLNRVSSGGLLYNTKGETCTSKVSIVMSIATKTLSL